MTTFQERYEALTGELRAAAEISDWTKRAVAFNRVASGYDQLARDLLAAVPVWRPIETAPTDGTEFLATIPVYTDGENNKLGHNEYHVLSLDDETGDLREYQGWDLEDYTHWMPLPEPPK